MSRIGIKAIKIPQGLEINISDISVELKNQNGQFLIKIPSLIIVKQNGDQIFVERQNNSKIARSLHGTIRNIISNAIIGLTNGFSKKLEMIGIGYRATMDTDFLNLQVGYTHPIKIKIPDGIKVSIEKNVITIQGTDKEKVGQFCAEIRAFKVPEPYKGKGIRYQGEKIRMKQGKALKSGA